jgi:hypothetical protein
MHAPMLRNNADAHLFDPCLLGLDVFDPSEDDLYIVMPIPLLSAIPDHSLELGNLCIGRYKIFSTLSDLPLQFL